MPKVSQISSKLTDYRQIACSPKQPWDRSCGLVADPQFVDPAGENWRLGETSPARGSGRDGVDLGAFPGEGPELLLGDINNDGRTNIADAIYLLGYLFSLGPEPWCMGIANVNGDDKINIADTIYLLGYLFALGPPPVPPEEPCPE